MLKKIKFFNTKKDFIFFLSFIFFIFSLNISYEYYKYKQLTSKKTAILEAYVLNQYLKTKNKKTYYVLKLKTDDGHIFYTTASKNWRFIKNKSTKIKIWTDTISFFGYLKSFYARGWFLHVKEDNSYKSKISSYIASIHKDNDISKIYQALFLAKPLSYQLYNYFSSLGISHLFAISGFHLGILSGVLFWIFGFILKPLYNSFFPYKNFKRDIFFLVIICLYGYLLFLDFPPSLTRAFWMLVVGFFLYDRGYEIISFETLFIAICLIIAFKPSIIFSIGFWLSVLGVFYIFLFLLYFKDIKIYKQFIFIPIFVYLTMLPTSLFIFENFSIYNPISIFITMGFSIFYPLSLALHLLGFGNILDDFILYILSFDINTIKIKIPLLIEIAFLIFSILAARIKLFFYLLCGFSVIIFLYAISYT